MGHDATLLRACELATSGRLLDARDEFLDLLGCDSLFRHVVLNNLAAVEASLGQLEIAKARLKQSAEFGPAAVPAQNIHFLDQFSRLGRSRPVLDAG